MRRAAVLLGFGLVLLWVQGGLATFLPPHFCPDLGLLLVISLGLWWRGLTSGLCMAAGLGYAADALSGSLLGLHALLRLVAFSGSRLASRQLNLRGPLPLAVFAACASVAYGLAAVGLTHFFSPSSPPSGDAGFRGLVDALVQALVTAVAAPAVSAAVQRVFAGAGEDEAARRPLLLEPRGPVA